MIQNWQRDVDAPCICPWEQPGQFDDTHLFAPCVALENEVLLRCGTAARATMLATGWSNAGFCSGAWPLPATTACILPKTPRLPGLHLGTTARHSILTPTLVRHPDGSLRQRGRASLRHVFFLLTDFPSGDRTPHPARNHDQRRRQLCWDDALRSPIRKRLRPHPVSKKTTATACGTPMSERSDPWTIRAAHSDDGLGLANRIPSRCPGRWTRILGIHDRLVYPTVLTRGRLLSGCGTAAIASYPQRGHENLHRICRTAKTACNWTKRTLDNPDLRLPTLRVPWESHFTLLAIRYLRLDRRLPAPVVRFAHRHHLSYTSITPSAPRDGPLNGRRRATRIARDKRQRKTGAGHLGVDVLLRQLRQAVPGA